MIKDYEITISNKNTGLIYDTLDLENIINEEIDNNKKYGIITDNESVIEAVSETIREYLTELNKAV